MRKKDAPCMDCPDRHVGCHGECEIYQEYRTRRNEELERAYNERKHKPYLSIGYARNWRNKLLREKNK